MSEPFIIQDGVTYLNADVVFKQLVSAAANGQGEPVWSLSKTHGVQINVERAESSIDAVLERVIRESCRKGYEAIAKEFPGRPKSIQPSYELKTAETYGGQEYAAGYVMGVGAGLGEDFIERARSEEIAKEQRLQSLEQKVLELIATAAAKAAADYKLQQRIDALENKTESLFEISGEETRISRVKISDL